MKLGPILFALSLVMPVAACGDDDNSSDTDAAANGADANPNQPDAAPVVYDANPNQPDAEPPTYDANPGVADEITCGETVCEAPQVCCVAYSGGMSYECTASDACSGNATLACDGPEDCPTAGEECCAGNGMDVSTSCTPTDSCGRKLCRELSECDVDNGETCCDLTVGISVCSTICF